jgi:hypothetical protein
MSETAILSTLTYDAIGSVTLTLLSKSTHWGRIERRVQRTRTLDGGYALSDFGQAECDRTIRLVWTADATTNQRVDYLVRNHAQLYLSCAHGFFRVAVQATETRRNETALDLLVLARITD